MNIRINTTKNHFLQFLCLQHVQLDPMNMSLTRLNGGRGTEREEGGVLIFIMSTMRHNEQGILVMVGRRVGCLVLGKVTKRRGRRESLKQTT